MSSTRMPRTLHLLILLAVTLSVAMGNGIAFADLGPPTITGSDPASGSNDNSPLIKGTVSPGTDDVAIFPSLQDCETHGLNWFGPASVFTTTGIEVSVSDDSTTTFYARGFDSDQGSISGCSAGFTYVEVSTPPDSDGDGLPDDQDPAPNDPDADGDGIPDGQDDVDNDADDDGITDSKDVEPIQEAVVALNADDFSATGQRQAILDRLEDVEAMVGAENEADARRALQNLRRRVDGCPPSPDRNDWVVDCEAQVEIRALIDDLIGNLDG